MNKREKVILFAAFLSILYGGYNFLFQKNKKKVVVQKVDYIKVKNEVLSKIKKNDLNSQEKIIYSLLDKSIKDPFLYLTAKERPKEEKTNVNVSFDYQGFIVVKNKRYAIINGREYAEGESLKEKGFKVWSILKTKVIIKGPGKNNFIVVPFIDKIKLGDI